jgi:hypothetical protein
MNVVKVIRGQAGQPVRLIHQGGVVYYGSQANLAELRLPVAHGQTRWNLGLSEPRRVLYYCGERMVAGVHYKIELPYLDWLSTIPIESSDQLILTIQ